MKKIKAEQLKVKMEANKTLEVINVLSEENYKKCHIKGSTSVPLVRLKDSVAVFDKNKEIVVYCASYDCKASQQAYKLLEELGFTNIAAYEGGTKEWKEKGFETAGEACAA